MNRGVMLLLFYCKYVQHLVKERNKINPTFIGWQHDKVEKFHIETAKKNSAYKDRKNRIG